MIKQIFVLLSILFFFISCDRNKRHHQATTKKRINILIDTLNPKTTYYKVKDFDAETVNDIYLDLTTSLVREEKFELLKQHMRYYKEINRADKFREALINLRQGNLYINIGKYDSAAFLLNRGLNLYKKSNRLKGVAECYAALGLYHLDKGDYEKSISYNYQSLKIYEQLKDTVSIFRQKSMICNNLFFHGEYNQTLSLLGECERYHASHGDKYGLATTHTFMGLCYYMLQNYHTAFTYINNSLPALRESGNPNKISQSLNSLGLVCKALRKPQMAIRYFKEALSMLENEGSKADINIIRLNVAYCNWELKNEKDASSIIYKVIEDAQLQGQKEHLASAYLMLTKINKDKKKFDLAFKNLKLYIMWSDSLYNEKKAKIISDLNIKYQTQQKDQQIKQLNIENKLEKAKKISYLLLAVIILIMAIGVALFFTSRHKRNKLSLQQVRLELEANKKDLHNFADNIITKNRFIDELEVKLSEINSSFASESNLKAEQLSELYQFKILTENDWMQFKIKADKVYPGLLNRLRIQYPDLSQGEQRQFLLIKLNIDNKEAASMLGISVSSVRQNRYRLKKKFGLSEQDDLDNFVGSFE